MQPFLEPKRGWDPRDPAYEFSVLRTESSKWRIQLPIKAVFSQRFLDTSDSLNSLLLTHNTSQRGETEVFRSPDHYSCRRQLRHFSLALFKLRWLRRCHRRMSPCSPDSSGNPWAYSWATVWEQERKDCPSAKGHMGPRGEALPESTWVWALAPGF